ncbi:hypothetical protein [Limosilactobacillus walteri]|uniref:Polysaccharide polymerase n=1 Tax=Limosilactobacillus walteri TaxID=2268022 RepID=A0ABR8P8S7_9LACO|nr:hypothetical protein [Limosilactobacillus walteri]MBD5807111.1 hypothetical protein [Limosilactobacillus walteri]
MQIANSNNVTLYEKMILGLLVIYSIASNIYAVNASSTYSLIEFIATIAIMIVGIVWYITSLRDFSSLIFLLFLVLLLFIFRFSYFALSVVSLGIAFFSVKVENIVYIYKYLSASQLIFGIFAAMVGFLPMYNSKTGSFTFGFVNENMTGMILAVFALCIFFKNDGEFIVNKLNTLFLIGVVFVEKFLFNDSTAIVMILSFLILFIAKKTIRRVKLIQLICIITPLILAIFSFYVSYAFSITSANWINKLNNLLSARIYIWNYYASNYPLTLFPNNWQINNKIFSGYFDGGYIYLGLFQGKIWLAIIVLGLCLANFKLIRHNNFVILAFMLSFEIAGFSENVLININESFAIILAFLAYNPSWIRNKNLTI